MNRFLEWLLGINPDELSAGDSWQLDLIAEHNNYVKLAMIAVLAAMAYLTIRSYRREGDTPKKTKALLSGLRILVIVLALLVLFRPAVVLRFSETLRSVVVVAIDDSLSMSRKDDYAKAPEHGAALAGFLGVEPQRLPEFSRTDVVRAALARRQGAMAELARRHPLIFLRYSTDEPARTDYTRPLATLGAAQIERKKKQPEDNPHNPDDDLGKQLTKVLATLTASGYETNLARVLYDALAEVEGRRAAGIVVIGDGQSTTEDSDKAIREEKDKASGRPVRLLTVLVGDDTLPTNVAVTSLQARRKVTRHSPLALEARVAHRNLGGETVTLRLLRRKRQNGQWGDWSEVGSPKTVPLEKQADPDHPEDEKRSVGLQVEKLTDENTDEVGTFEYKAAIDKLDGEQNPDDNSAVASVEVTDEKVNVLLISADAGWEFQYLRNVLLRQEDMFRVGVWQQNADEDVNQMASEGMALKQLPSSIAELMGSPGGKPHPGYRVVILYDPQPSQAQDDRTRGMTPLVKMLQQFVKDGGGLCYIAGNKHSDAVVEKDGAFKPLAQMLPVVLRPNTINVSQRIAQGRPKAYPIRLTTYGIEHPVTDIGDAEFKAKDIWPVLPGVYWTHPVYKIKPAARVLAENENPLRRTTEGNAEPLVAVQPYGSGRVLYLGFDATWRWRYVRDGKFHRRFWINVVQYLASPKARQVIITAGGDTFRAGKEIKIEVTAHDEEYQPLRDKTFKVEMIKKGTDERRTLELQAVEGKPGKYTINIRPKQAGRYLLTALWGDPNRQDKVQSKEILIEIPQAEKRRPEANPALMRLIASDKDGFLRIHQIDKLSKLIHSDPLTTVRVRKREIWDSNLTLLLIVVLLAAEWILRKKHNMA